MAKPVVKLMAHGTWAVNSMRALVTVKRVLDPYVNLHVKSDGSGVDLTHAKMTMNPFDEVAVEAAICLREQGALREVVVLSIGHLLCQETLRYALALGADRALHVLTDDVYDCLNIAKIIQHIIIREQPHLVVMGKQSSDGDNNQIPQMLAGLLDWPQLTCAYGLNMKSTNLIGQRDTEYGTETLQVCLPAVVSVDLRCNTPRYATLPNIMKARQKPLVTIGLSTLDLSLTEHQQVLNVRVPAARNPVIQVKSLLELLERLKNEAQVLP